jgi:ribosomal protein S18 acetylase RimI-like enzyme
MVRGDDPVGRLYLDRGGREYRVIDIALLPEQRGQGLGGALLRDLMDDAAASGKGLPIHVEKSNRALRLYRRLGFVTVGDRGVHCIMRWTAPAPVNTAS